MKNLNLDFWVGGVAIGWLLVSFFEAPLYIAVATGVIAGLLFSIENNLKIIIKKIGNKDD